MVMSASADVFATLESEVRSYCRAWPTVFTRARGATIEDEAGNRYVDFFSGAGGLNYGHNPPEMIEALIEYLRSDGILHSLDMSTVAKRDFLARFHDVILAPRGMDYRVQFPGPTGTNSVEAALKLARKVTGRRTIVSFTNAFHGMTLGSLAVTANPSKRQSAGVPLEHTATVPYDGQMGDADTVEVLDAMLGPNGELGEVAAVIVETVQGEGGLHAASMAWLQRLEACCRRHGALLIVDDIQAGCGRTGTFFSFEPAGISPDIICLSKSISGSGLPMALTLIRPERGRPLAARRAQRHLPRQQRRVHHRCRGARLVDRRQPVSGSRRQGQPRARRTRFDHRRARAAPRHDPRSRTAGRPAHTDPRPRQPNRRRRLPARPANRDIGRERRCGEADAAVDDRGRGPGARPQNPPRQRRRSSSRLALRTQLQRALGVRLDVLPLDIEREILHIAPALEVVHVVR